MFSSFPCFASFTPPGLNCCLKAFKTMNASAIKCGGWHDDSPRGPDRRIRHSLARLDRRSRSPQSFIRRQLTSTPIRPAVSWSNWTKEIIWFNLIVVTTTPLISLYGIFTTSWNSKTLGFCVSYYVFNMIGAQC